ncbi:MAG TPA: hypothetical protein VMR28_03420 [Candidatus Saccharimonadales bacterium]|nr:hypothetical protein [Candidatus Saccharimonadales bacterium]
MTRMLSELLGAQEPTFRINVRELERASGDPSADIRLSADIDQQVQTKIRELGLKPHDTTGEELYHALQQRLTDDEHRLRDYLGLDDDAISSTVMAATQRLIKQFNIPKECFALKFSVAKRLLREVPPKKAMKYLGYRSLDSMLKHEPVPQLYTAALLYESTRWHQAFLAQYAQLEPSAFESRPVAIYYSQSERWQELAKEFATRFRHTSVAFMELGAIVILPITETIPALAITSTLLLLADCNDIRCSSSFLKLQQVKPDFGQLVAKVATDKPYTIAQLAGQSLPWRTMQYYYSQRQAVDVPASFEPHIQPEDLQLAQAEKALAHVVPALEFWENTAPLALVKNGQTVSLNMLDVALSVANQLPFVDRVVHYVRDRVWQELLTSYLNPYNLERVLRQLGDEVVEPAPTLAAELETADV